MITPYILSRIVTAPRFLLQMNNVHPIPAAAATRGRGFSDPNLAPDQAGHSAAAASTRW